jgi:hypothetical protein
MRAACHNLRNPICYSVLTVADELYNSPSFSVQEYVSMALETPI